MLKLTSQNCLFVSIPFVIHMIQRGRCITSTLTHVSENGPENYCRVWYGKNVFMECSVIWFNRETPNVSADALKRETFNYTGDIRRSFSSTKTDCSWFLNVHYDGYIVNDSDTLWCIALSTHHNVPATYIKVRTSVHYIGIFLTYMWLVPGAS